MRQVIPPTSSPRGRTRQPGRTPNDGDDDQFQCRAGVVVLAGAARSFMVVALGRVRNVACGTVRFDVYCGAVEVRDLM